MATNYEQLFRESAPALWRALYAYTLGRRDLADDAVAEAFARALQYSGSIRDPLPWIYRTAFRIASAEIRRQSRTLDRVYSEVEATAEDVIDLMEALGKLSKSQRTAVFLHYQADLPLDRVAKLMGTSVAVVKVHLFRGRRKLRQLLGDGGAH